MQTKFLISEIPDEMTITEYISSKTDYKELTKKIKPVSVPSDTTSITFKNSGFDYLKLWEAVKESLTLHGEHGWLKDDQHGNTVASEIYTGFSLMYNPTHTDIANPHQSSLGTGRMVDFKLYQNNFKHKKHTYLDTLGFRQRTPASKTGYLGEFFDSFKSSMTRGRMSIINADKFVHRDQLKEYGWHHDEPIFENLRINIPLITDEVFKFQIQSRSPYHLEVGKSYTWDTAIMHRVFPDTLTTKMRAHLVIGISPWFDYDSTDDSWNINEYYGNVHPFDMLVNGHVVDGLEFESSNK